MRVKNDRSIVHTRILRDYRPAFSDVIRHQHGRDRHIHSVTAMRQYRLKSRFTRLPMTRFPTSAGSASAATNFTIAFARLAECNTWHTLLLFFHDMTECRPTCVNLLAGFCGTRRYARIKATSKSRDAKTRFQKLIP